MSSRKASRTYPGWPVLLVLLVLGGIIGGWLGKFLIEAWPALGILGKTQSIGLPAFTLDLRVFVLHFGFMFNINLFTIIGFVVAYLVFRKM